MRSGNMRDVIDCKDWLRHSLLTLVGFRLQLAHKLSSVTVREEMAACHALYALSREMRQFINMGISECSHDLELSSPLLKETASLSEQCDSCVGECSLCGIVSCGKELSRFYYLNVQEQREMHCRVYVNKQSTTEALYCIVGLQIMTPVEKLLAKIASELEQCNISAKRSDAVSESLEEACSLDLQKAGQIVLDVLGK